VRMWRDPDASLRRNCIHLIETMYRSGISEVRECFSSNITSGLHVNIVETKPGRVNIVEEISSLLADKDFTEKDALQKLWLCFIENH
jgi:hypothetical protein